jgi:antitoxin HicB
MRLYRGEAALADEKRDPYEGWTSLDDFLAEEGIREEVTARAIKRVIALQLQQAMIDQKLSKARMAELMETSRAQLARILDPEEYNVTLDTLARAAKVLGRRLSLELI